MIYVLPTKQPPRLASSRNRSTSSPLNKDATEMEPCKIRGTTQPLVSRTGAGRQVNTFSFRSREKNVLDFSSYRSGFIANYLVPSPIIWRDMKHLLIGIYILLAVCIGFAQDSEQATAQPQAPGLGEVALGDPIQYG